MRIFKYGKLFELLYPNRLWSKKEKEKIIYLTFDDGPVPEATPFVLQELEKVGAKATFFVVGDNVRKNQEVFQSVVNHGHRIANHTMNHLNGEHCRTVDYIENVKYCEQQIEQYNQPAIMRPPYGKLTKKQEKELKQYQVVMWSVLTYDFDANLSAETCLEKAIQLTKNGSIVLMHDSVKTIGKLKYVLPLYLEHFTSQGYQFKCL